MRQIPDAVDTVMCARDDGWRYHPKHVEQFPGKINYVTLHLVGYILEQNVSVYLPPSSGRNYVFLTSNLMLVHS